MPYIQSFEIQTSGSGTSITTPAFQAIGSNDAICGIVFASQSATSISDNAAGYTNQYQILGSNEWSTFGIWVTVYCGVNIQGNPTELILGFSNPETNPIFSFDEFSSISGINTYIGPNENDTANPSITITTTSVNCLIWELILSDSQTQPSTPNNFTLLTNDFESTGEITAYWQQPTPGSVSAVWTQNAVANLLAAIALSPTTASISETTSSIDARAGALSSAEIIVEAGSAATTQGIFGFSASLFETANASDNPSASGFVATATKAETGAALDTETGLASGAYAANLSEIANASDAPSGTMAAIATTLAAIIENGVQILENGQPLYEIFPGAIEETIPNDAPGANVFISLAESGNAFDQTSYANIITNVSEFGSASDLYSDLISEIIFETTNAIDLSGTLNQSNINEIANATDTPTYSSISKSIVESGTASDTNSAALTTISETTAETAIASDAPSVSNLAATASRLETGSALDTETGLAVGAYAAGLLEAASAAETPTGAMAATNSAFAAIVEGGQILLEAGAPLYEIFPGTQEQGNAADAYSFAAITASDSEAGTAVDTPILSNLTVTRSDSEAGIVVDGPNVSNLTATASQSETGAANDTETGLSSGAYSANLSENANASDISNYSGVGNLSFTESASATETLSELLGIPLNEAANASASQSATPTLAANLAETGAATDHSIATLAVNLSIHETAIAADFESQGILGAVNVTFAGFVLSAPQELMAGPGELMGVGPSEVAVQTGGFNVQSPVICQMLESLGVLSGIVSTRVISPANLSESFIDFTLSGTATSHAVAHVSLSETLADFTLAGTMRAPDHGSLAEAPAAFTLAATMRAPDHGSLSETFANFALAGTMRAPDHGSLTETLADFTTTTLVTIGQTVHASLSETASNFTLVAHSTHADNAMVSEILGGLTSIVLVSHNPNNASLNESAVDFTLIAAAHVPAHISLAEIPADLTLSATTKVPAHSALSEATANFTLAGRATNPTIASLNQTLGILTDLATIDVQDHATTPLGEGTRPATAASIGKVQVHIASNETLGSLTAVATGHVAHIAVVSETLGNLVSISSVQHSDHAILSETLASLTAIATAIHPLPHGNLSEVFVDFILSSAARAPSHAQLMTIFPDFVLTSDVTLGLGIHVDLNETPADFVLVAQSIHSDHASISETFGTLNAIINATHAGAHGSLNEITNNFILAATAENMAVAALSETILNFTLNASTRVGANARLSVLFSDFTLLSGIGPSSIGTFAVTIPDFTAIGTVHIPIHFDLSEGVGSFVFSSQVKTGIVAAMVETMVDFSVSALSAHIDHASLAGVLGPAGILCSGHTIDHGSLNLTIPNFILISQANHSVVHGSVSGNLGILANIAATTIISHAAVSATLGSLSSTAISKHADKAILSVSLESLISVATAVPIPININADPDLTLGTLSGTATVSFSPLARSRFAIFDELVRRGQRGQDRAA